MNIFKLLLRDFGRIPLCNRRIGSAVYIRGFCLPLCARCLSIIAGTLFSNHILRLIIPLENVNLAIFSILLILPCVIDGYCQYFKGIESNNYRRFLTGFPAGVAIPYLMWHISSLKIFEEIFMDLIKMLGIPSAVLIITVFIIKSFGKKLIDYLFSKNLEISKIQFSNLHSKRMEFIEQIHTNLFDLHDLVNSYLETTHYVLNDAEEEEYQREKQVFELLGKIQTDFKKQKLYLSKTLSDKIESLINKFSASCFQGNFLKNSLNSKHISDEDWKLLKVELKELSEANRDAIPPILTKIESDFREIFGIK